MAQIRDNFALHSSGSRALLVNNRYSLFIVGPYGWVGERLDKDERVTKMEHVYSKLAESGICATSPLYSKEQIAKWNVLLDEHIKQQTEGRRYASADAIYQMGMLGEIFNQRMRDLIEHLMPDAVLHHCHIYEIEGNQAKSHIHSHNGRQGWHRDEECLPDFELSHPNFVSIFVYLTDVEIENGPFEIADYPPSTGLEIVTNRPSFKMVGETGYSFVFDRAFMHRASPNVSATPRRVLKLSIQPPQFENTRIGLEEFTRVRQNIEGTDPFLEQLFGKAFNAGKVSRGKTDGLADLPAVLPLSHNAKIEIPLTTEGYRHFKRASLKVRRAILGR